MHCQNNLKQLALALHNYADTDPGGRSRKDDQSKLPAGTVPNDGLPAGQRLSWLVELLPYVEQAELSGRIDRASAWDAARNAEAAKTVLKVFRCYDWERENGPDHYRTTYVGTAGLGADAPTLPPGDPRAGAFGYDRRASLVKIEDGTSNTILILETSRDNGPWAQGGSATVRGLDPADRPHLGVGRPWGGTHFAENTLFGRGKSLGCNTAFADGSVRFLNESTAPEILEALLTKAGGEKLPGDW
jgi:prepilin-type processing-associated H-X9-DG protein